MIWCGYLLNHIILAKNPLTLIVLGESSCITITHNILIEKILSIQKVCTFKKLLNIQCCTIAINLNQL